MAQMRDFLKIFQRWYLRCVFVSIIGWWLSLTGSWGSTESLKHPLITLKDFLSILWQNPYNMETFYTIPQKFTMSTFDKFWVQFAVLRWWWFEDFSSCLSLCLWWDVVQCITLLDRFFKMLSLLQSIMLEWKRSLNPFSILLNFT